MIFISYRREDSKAAASRLHEKLQDALPSESVFLDFDTIPPGVDFRQFLSKALESAKVLIPIIGHHWEGRVSDGTARISHPDDYVRFEISYALQNGVTVLPVLLDGRSMPSQSELPEDIRNLSYQNALTLDTGRGFRDDSSLLCNRVMELLDKDRTDIGPLHLPRNSGIEGTWVREVKAETQNAFRKAEVLRIRYLEDGFIAECVESSKGAHSYLRVTRSEYDARPTGETSWQFQLRTITSLAFDGIVLECELTEGLFDRSTNSGSVLLERQSLDEFFGRGTSRTLLGDTTITATERWRRVDRLATPGYSGEFFQWDETQQRCYRKDDTQIAMMLAGHHIHVIKTGLDRPEVARVSYKTASDAARIFSALPEGLAYVGFEEWTATTHDLHFGTYDFVRNLSNLLKAPELCSFPNGVLLTRRIKPFRRARLVIKSITPVVILGLVVVGFNFYRSFVPHATTEWAATTTVSVCVALVIAFGSFTPLLGEFLYGMNADNRETGLDLLRRKIVTPIVASIASSIGLGIACFLVNLLLAAVPLMVFNVPATNPWFVGFQLGLPAVLSLWGLMLYFFRNHLYHL